MGCDIHSLVEIRDGDEWIVDEFGVFDDRNYSWFGFLAGVRGRAAEPISLPRGLPIDVSEKARDWFDWDCHSHSWLTVEELVYYDYGRRVPDPFDPDVEVTVRELLGGKFFEILGYLSLNVGYEGVELSDIRIVFAFDN